MAERREITERMRLNEERGYPYFHQEPTTVPCADPGACHVRGYCWTFWKGKSPLPRKRRG